MKYLKDITGDSSVLLAQEIMELLYKCKFEGGGVYLSQHDIIALLEYIEKIQGMIPIKLKVTPSA